MKQCTVVTVKLASGNIKTSLPSSEDDGEFDSDLSSDPTRVSEDDILESVSDQTLTFNSHDKSGCAWEKFGELIDKAKEREVQAGDRIASEVIIDFGALSFVERRRTSRKVEDDKEEAIRKALSLGEEGDLWCKFVPKSKSVLSHTIERLHRSHLEKVLNLDWFLRYLNALHRVLDEDVPRN